MLHHLVTPRAVQASIANTKASSLPTIDLTTYFKLQVQRQVQITLDNCALFLYRLGCLHNFIMVLCRKVKIVNNRVLVFLAWRRVRVVSNRLYYQKCGLVDRVSVIVRTVDSAEGRSCVTTRSVPQSNKSQSGMGKICCHVDKNILALQ